MYRVVHWYIYIHVYLGEPFEGRIYSYIGIGVGKREREREERSHDGVVPLL